MTGKVKWFDAKKGYGFILPSGDGPETFVHFSAIQTKGFRSLNPGALVSYEPQSDERGTRAEKVIVLGNPPATREPHLKHFHD